MSHKKTFLAAIIFVAVLTIAPFAYCIDQNPAPQGASKAHSKPVVVEEVWVVLVDEPSHHFHLAYENFLRKEKSAAAREIRTGSAFLKLESSRATEEGKKTLSASIKELDKLADDVEKGTVSSAKQLNDAFARAHHALARHHYLKALEAWDKKETKSAGEALKASTTHLERAMTWAGYKEEDLIVKTVKDTGFVTQKLIEGGGWVSDEVGRILESLGKAIEKFGKAIGAGK